MTVPYPHETETAHMRARISRRLLARRPNADDATRRQLTGGLREALSNHEELDEDAVKQALLMIDKLQTLPGASCHERGRTPRNGSHP